MKARLADYIAQAARGRVWIILFVASLGSLSPLVQAQPFTDVSERLIQGTTLSALPQFSSGAVAWGDYDNDGKPDFIMMGKAPNGGRAIRLYRNMGDGFREVGGQLLPRGQTGLADGAVAWGDYDNDNKLDLIITGNGVFGPDVLLLRNTGNGFVNVTSSQLHNVPGLEFSTVNWADYDQDGKLDFLLTGNSASGPVSKLYRNTGSGFTDVTAQQVPGLPGVSSGSVAWADYDLDERPDFLLTGTSDSGPVSKLYRNTGSGFTDVTSQAPGLPGVSSSSVAWADFDLDGKPDFLLTGNTGTGLTSKLYRNTGSEFADVTGNQLPGVPGVSSGSVAWGDFNRDGKPDLLLTGNTDGGTLSKLYRNNGNGFTDVTDQQISKLPQVGNSTVTWADYDTDGWLDLLLMGNNTTGTFGRLYHNGTNYGNFVNVTESQLPDVPKVSSSSIAWGDYDNDGKPDFIMMGETGTGNGFVSRLYRNTGSGFVHVTATQFPGGLPQVTAGSVAWGDYDNDGKLDVFITGKSGAGPVSKLYRNLGGTFSEVTSSQFPGGLPQLFESSVAWGDYDNDGKLDLLLTGDGGEQVGPVSKLYRNTGSGFEDVTDSQVRGLPRVSSGSVSWADFDNDRRLDFLITGDNRSDRISRLYRNTGNGFEDVTEDRFKGALPGLIKSSVAWGDYDRDGRLDLLIVGENKPQEGRQYGGFRGLYANTSNVFIDVTGNIINPQFSASFNATVAWGDYDNDGWLDFMFAGRPLDRLLDGQSPVRQIHHNLSGHGFVMVANYDFYDAAEGGSIAWVDYDTDGRLDHMYTGAYDANFGPDKVTRFTRLNRNSCSPLSIAAQPASRITGCLGSRFSTSVRIEKTGADQSAVPAAAYQWYKDGVLLSSQTSAELTINNLQPSDAGQYQVVISGCNSLTSTPFTLSVSDAVTLSGQPASSSVVCSGSNVSTSVAVSGPNPTFQWYKDGTPLSGQTSASLALTNLQASDSGEYTVVVTGCNSLTSSVFSLTVNQAISMLAQPFSSSAVCPGASVSASVDVSGTNPTFQWYREGTQLSGQTSATLTLSNLQPADAGSYVVVITSSCSSLTSTAFSLSLNQPLTITQQPPGNSISCVGGSFSAGVSVSGSNPTFQWYREGVLISGQTSASLTLTNLQGSDAGAYTVVITGCNSLTSSSLSLAINQPLTIARQPASGTLVCMGTTVSTSVDVSGSNPAFQWYKDGTPLSGQTSASLILASPQTTDAGSYVVVITSSCSSLTSAAYSLSLNQPLTITQQPPSSSAVCAGSNFSISVGVSGSNPTFQWYKDGAAYSGQTSATLTLTNLQPSDAGRYLLFINGTCNNLIANDFNLTINQGADLTLQAYARPSILYGTSPVTLVVNVDELHGVATSGPIRVKVPKEAKLSLNLPASATSVGGRPVVNSAWRWDAGSDAGYYLLSTEQGIGAGGLLSFGLEGLFNPEGTSGTFRFEIVLESSGACETVDNNTDGERIDYFP
ncbi:FG-GAP-like repeat-containing protein [Spirosoma validum]|uniref:VCBS repeat-containing protein n=1 Tax=Spirosoma validum TaxID=2771355 RepID=A0A927B8Q2_9BACT|nr:FG-GAP-like repeat-containing protein [Spirosoma validum]MBD2757261.1 VCBS repeat-containing protein [Spirosoma validum]